MSDPLAGPYTVGVCAYGHGTNGAGRCEPLNTDPDAVPPTCPVAADRAGWYEGQPRGALVAAAELLDVIAPAQASPRAIAALIVAAEVAQGLVRA